MTALPPSGLEARVGSAPSARVRRRPTWHPATVAAVSPETPTARRIVLDVPTWPGNDPGQHLDLRLTAEDGYQATRSYSIASAGDDTRVTLAVDRVDDGEVSPFLVDAVQVGDALDVHGPLGGWFVWRPDPSTASRPVQLIAGGSGFVPLAAMIAAHTDAEDPTPFRLLYAVRTPDDVFFRSTLEAARVGSAPFAESIVYSRRAPDPSAPVGRLTRRDLAAAVFPPEDGALVYVCGSTPFVEQVLRWLGELGHDTSDVRAERFGGS
ncbi:MULTISPECIES: FAD-binding oxidoreductase [unclassified Curtobacterium]|uniref:FAD-binding oxidoreductase n=1 Tax=unclassified Curtobacterium TaxID=257496 RepID=UPI00381F5AB7